MFLKVIYSRKTIWFAELCSLSMALFSLLKGDYMNILYGIIIGIVAEKFVFPLIDSLTELVTFWIEEKRNRIVYQINSLNEQDEEELNVKRPIGFRQNEKGDEK